MESKIVSAEEIAKQFFYAHDINVIRCIKAAQRQAIEATLGHMQLLDNDLILVHENKLIDIVSIINSPELKVS